MQPVEYKPATEGKDYTRLFNFSPGPGTLPEEVLLEVRDELPVYQQIGSAIIEASHRSAAYDAIDQNAKRLIKKLLGLPDDWHVLFLQGGASMQFYQVPLNFFPKGGSADYVVTGAWAKKAYHEAKHCGTPRVAATSADRNFCYIPDRAAWDLDPGAAYLHFTSNNTIFGTQFPDEPEVDVPLVCDASSDFMSRPITAERYGLIYAGAQKNVGPSGVTVVLIRPDFLERRNQPLPTMLDYGTHAKEMFNTPPVFAVYMVEKVLRWLDGLGGIPAMAQRNEAKAKLLYDRIDATGFYTGTADVAARSKMNVTFRLPSEELEKRFIAEAKANGLLELKGHRSVGGVRASIYNAMPVEGVEALVAFMDDFEQQNG